MGAQKPPEPDPKLKVPRADAKRRLEERVVLGWKLLRTEVGTPEVLEKNIADAEKWRKFNDSLLKLLFTTPAIAEEYGAGADVPSLASFGQVSFRERVEELREEIGDQVQRLESIVERLELFSEAERANSQPPIGAANGQSAFPEDDERLKVFVSHSGADARLTELLVDFLRTALTLRGKEIRATSVEGSRLQGGADTQDKLREELLAAPVFLGLISSRSFTSAYVLFELGARWGAKKHILPLLAPGTDASILRGPIANTNALRCYVPAQMHQLVAELGEQLNRPVEPAAAYQSKLEALTFYREPEPAAPEKPAVAKATNSPASTDEPYETSEHVIQAHCEEQWPEDFSMRAYCIRQQREAVRALKRGGPEDIPGETFGRIRTACATQWANDYSMRVYCEKQQVEAYREIKRGS
jgi:hypothetical protein